jgi:hypothetical protein
MSLLFIVGIDQVSGFGVQEEKKAILVFDPEPCGLNP